MWHSHSQSRCSYLKSTSEAPGPGSYELPSKIIEGPHYQFRIKNYKSMSQNSPGPGTYEIPKIKIRGGLINHTAERVLPKTDNIKSNLPGPGSYQPGFVKSRSSTFFGVSKRKEFKDSSTPGPGTYTIQLRPTSSATSFGLGKRFTLINSYECNTSYELPSTIGEGPKFTIKPKKKAKPTSEVPGPGTYNPELTPEGPFYSFGGVKSDLFDTKERSPGSIYEVDGKILPLKSYTWGKRERSLKTFSTEKSLNDSLLTVQNKDGEISATEPASWVRSNTEKLLPKRFQKKHDFKRDSSISIHK